MDALNTDVVIIGGSLAGCTTASFLAARGLKVIVVEREREVAAYKKVCTHLIQNTAIPTLRRMGILDELVAAGAVKTGLQLWTRWGWSNFTPEVDEDAFGPTWPLNLRREVLDPLLRQHAARSENVTFLSGHSARSLVQKSGVVCGVEVEGPGGSIKTLHAKLVVGADGRNSRIAELAEVPTETLPNNRGGYMAYYRGVQLQSGRDAQFWLLDPDIAYAFPTDDGQVLLAVLVTRDKFKAFKADPEAWLERVVARLPDAPNLTRAQRVGPFRGMLEMPNTYRRPYGAGLALVGDAALATDPVWGQGCGWAFESAELLANTVAPALLNGSPLDTALRTYARAHRERFYGEHKLNAGYSTGGPFDPVRKLIYSSTPLDARLRRIVFEVQSRRRNVRTGNLAILARAAWVQATRWARPVRPRALPEASGVRHA